MLSLLLAVGLASAAPARFETQPYFRPYAGLSAWGVNGQSQSVLAGGVEGGFQFFETRGPWPRITGVTRARFEAFIGSTTVSGQQLRVGAFGGPTWRRASISVGPDFFVDQYRINGVEVPAQGGVAAPLTGTVWNKRLMGWAGVQPAWYLGDREGVDWSEVDAPGLGDECAWFAGAGYRLNGIVVGVEGTVRTTSFGTNRSWGLTARVDPGNLAGKGKKGKGRGGRGRNRP